MKFASTSSGAHQDFPKSMAQILWTGITLNFITGNVVERKYRTAKVAKHSIALMSDISWQPFGVHQIVYAPSVR
jgi:hypothetical protein